MKTYTLLFFVLLFISIIHAQEKYIITSDSVKLYVNVKGKGIPCLYLHGGPGADSNFLEKLVGDSLEKHFQMIYLDQRGCGRSSSPKDNDYSMDRMIKDFEEIRTCLGIKKWITLGHSFGGILQMGYIKQYPDIIKGMIMINCTLDIKESFYKSWFPKACELLNITDREFYFDETVPVKTRLDSLVMKLVRNNTIWKMSFASLEEQNSLYQVYSNMPKRNNDFQNIALNLKDYYYDFDNGTGKTTIPVLFLYGTRDWCIGPEYYKNVNFSNMLLWKTDFEHMSPFIGDNRATLLKAICCYLEKYKL